MSQPCAYCNRRPRGKFRQQVAARYSPYCSYGCQERHRLDDAMAYIRGLREQAGDPPPESGDVELEPAP